LNLFLILDGYVFPGLPTGLARLGLHVRAAFSRTASCGGALGPAASLSPRMHTTTGSPAARLDCGHAERGNRCRARRHAGPCPRDSLPAVRADERPRRRYRRPVFSLITGPHEPQPFNVGCSQRRLRPVGRCRSTGTTTSTHRHSRNVHRWIRAPYGAGGCGAGVLVAPYPCLCAD